MTITSSQTGGFTSAPFLLRRRSRFVQSRKQAEPFGVIEATHLRFVFQFLEPFGQAVETEGVQLVECGMSEHEDFLSMVVAGTAQIGVVEERGRTAVIGRRVALTGEEGGDALAIEDAQFDGVGRHRLDAGRVEAAIRAQDAQAGAEPLFGMRPAGEHGADQAFGVRPDLAGPAAEPIRRPLGVTPVGAGHVVGVRAVLAAHVAALVDADALTAMEDLDRARGDPHLNLGADERVWNRIQKVMDLDVIVEIDPRAPPFRELPIWGCRYSSG